MNDAVQTHIEVKRSESDATTPVNTNILCPYDWITTIKWIANSPEHMAAVRAVCAPYRIHGVQLWIKEAHPEPR